MNLYLHLKDTDILMDDDFNLNSNAEIVIYLKNMENKIDAILKNKYPDKLYVIQAYYENEMVLDKFILRSYLVTFETRSFNFYFYIRF